MAERKGEGMVATGIVRRVDDLGRIAIPEIVRIEQCIAPGMPMELFTGDGAVIFKKYLPDNYVVCHNCKEEVVIPDGAGYQYCPYCGQRLSH